MLLEYESSDSMCLSTDAHMDFNVGWDNTIIADWASVKNEFAVLTVYPGDVTMKLDKPSHGLMIELCGWTLENGIPRGRRAQDVILREAIKPPLTMNWAAGLSFHRCHMERAVPVDRHLRWIFTGEEINRAARLFTHGYDMYLPTKIAVLHNYSDAGQGYHDFGDKNGTISMKSQLRLARLLETWDNTAKDDTEEDGEEALGEFGLGTQRSLLDYVLWSRANLGGKWADRLKDPRGRVHDTSPEECRWLQRQPVKDPAALLANVGVRRGADALKVNAAGVVEIEGEDASVRPVKVL